MLKVLGDTEYLSVFPNAGKCEQNADQNNSKYSPYLVRMRENARKMRTRITLNTDTFHAVLGSLKSFVQHSY